MGDNLWLGIFIGLGVVAGVLAIVYGGRGLSRASGEPAKPTALGWCVFAFGLVSLGITAWGLLVFDSGPETTVEPFPLLCGAGVAILIAGIAALVKRDRHWPTWTGLAIGLPAPLAVGVFALGYVVAHLLGHDL